MMNYCEQIIQEYKNKLKEVPIIECEQLAICITRRCNFKCAHCLRGDAQDMDISDEVLEQVAKTIKPMGITFTGGEPALNIQAMRKYIEYAKQYDTLPRYFFIATNGSINQQELALFCLEMYSLMGEADACQLTISKDVYHMEYTNGIMENKAKIFQGLSFFDATVKAHPYENDNEKWILSVGRAEENSLGIQKDDRIYELIPETSLINDDGRYCYFFDRIYITTDGNVMPDCNCSYDEEDQLALCTVGIFPKWVMTQYPIEENEEYDTVEE